MLETWLRVVADGAHETVDLADAPVIIGAR
jgi:hypothetical protein